MLTVRNNWENLIWSVDGTEVVADNVRSVDIALHNGQDVVRVVRCAVHSQGVHRTVSDMGREYSVHTTDLYVDLPIGYDSKDTVKVSLSGGKISGEPLLDRVQDVELVVSLEKLEEMRAGMRAAEKFFPQKHA